MEIDGLPLHPLLVHGVVLLVPVAALLAIVYALVPKWRYLLRNPALAFALAAVVMTQVASLTGQDLRRDRNLRSAQVETHDMWAGRLELGALALAAVAAVAWWVLPHISALAGGSDKKARMPVLVPVVMVLLPIAGVAVLLLVIATGHAGAEAVWNAS
ncbi:hypothetical protein EV649_2300 [Kribbella sp. VKM Ac-2569]|uniref:DUF2231 domain-containing protein n=1 Tax=Kribbella sp. VKM Ac-2569 TaxID=2512220 RepID=UPI00102C12A7|nr:DUF2231 domain-containing protein [Kribbella sp. VKM Ac-2569]RZT28523.1 hypothetical protein EV649_2300 [Kribbella sp. VKM Ac-2569]